jgi:hypothetical protein
MNMSFKTEANKTAVDSKIRSELVDRVEKILQTQELSKQKQLIKAIAADLQVSFLDCASVLLFLNENCQELTVNQTKLVENKLSNVHKSHPEFRLIRFRLDVGSEHNLTQDQLKKVLVAESGVDINNIVNVRIQATYTLIDLPDEMPEEIFRHLKEVEINHRKLDIKRVKMRHKKRGGRRFRQPNPQLQNTALSDS